MKWCLAGLLATLLSLSASAGTCSYRTEEVRHAGLVAKLYLPDAPGKLPGVIAFGGSEGGLQAGEANGEMMAPHCIAVLGLAFFRAPGLPATLDQVPLEYFQQALDYLAAVPAVDATRIGIVSGSRGSEAALWLATQDARIRSVALTTPSHSAWGGRTTDGSAWTFQGRQLPWLSPVQGDEQMPQVRRFELALQDAQQVAAARFHIERINGPLLLISAEQDQIWPSTQMAEEMLSYLAKAGFRHALRHDRYPTGHGFSQALAPRIKQSIIEHFLQTL